MFYSFMSFFFSFFFNPGRAPKYVAFPKIKGMKEVTHEILILDKSGGKRESERLKKLNCDIIDLIDLTL